LLQQVQNGWVLLHVSAAVGTTQQQRLHAIQQLSGIHVDL
jgi:hypothetical protein